jgi:ribosomal protein L40E
MIATVIGGTDNIGSIIQPKYSDGFIIGNSTIVNTMIEKLEIVNQENLVKNMGGGKSIASALGWGTIGGLAFGPIGGLAGLVFGGRKPQKTADETILLFALYLKDGRRYLVKSDTYTFQTIETMFFSAPKGNNSESGELLVVCMNCENKYPISAKFCKYCEAENEYIFCRNCGYVILKSYKFCSKCGAKIAK